MNKLLKKLSDVKPDKNQPRRKTGFGEEEIKELADSIKSVGIVVPILIQKDGTIIDGERRWRASNLIGLKEIPVIYDDNLTGVQRLEYQLICSLNSTSCAEEEIAPKIKEYIDKSGYHVRSAAERLGKSVGYIQTMVKSLADLDKSEKDIIKLWRETNGEKGMAPSNLAEVKQQHPDKKEELIEQAKEQVVTRSEIRGVAKEKATERFVEEQKKKYDEVQKSDDEGIKVIRTGEILQSVREEISKTTKELDRFFYKVKAVRFARLSWKNPREQKDFKTFVNHSLDKAKMWVMTLEKIKEDVDYEN